MHEDENCLRNCNLRKIMSNYRSLADNFRLYLYFLLKNISFFSKILNFFTFLTKNPYFTEKKSQKNSFFRTKKLISHCLGAGFPVWTEGLRN